MKQIQHEGVLVKLRESIAIVTLARPTKRNALICSQPRIAEQTANHGFFSESMLVAIAQSAL